MLHDRSPSPRPGTSRSRDRAAVALAALAVATLFAARDAAAQTSPWQTAPVVGPNQVVYTLDLACTGGGLVCAALDGYVDQQTAELSGSGQLDIDLAAGTVQFLQDGVVDLMDGQGPRASFTSTAASDLLFAEIPFVGAPQTQAGAVFALSNPVLDAGGPLVAGSSYPFSAIVSYGALADVVGPVDAYLPEIVLPPSDVALDGTLVVQAVFSGVVIYQLRDLTASLSVQNQTTLLGENVTVFVTADMTLNLRGLEADQTPSIVPGLGPASVAVLVFALGGAGVIAARRRD